MPQVSSQRGEFVAGVLAFAPLCMGIIPFAVVCSAAASSELAGDTLVWAMIVGNGRITFLIRLAAIAPLARADLPVWVKQAPHHVPPAVMAGSIAPPLFFVVGAPTIAPDLPRILAAAFAAMVAWRTQSTLLTVVLGMLALWARQALLG